jgi:hypothetical protein
MLSKEVSMKVERLPASTVLFATAAFLAFTTVFALAKDAKAPAWKDGHVHGFVGCLAQESNEVGYFDLVDAKTDDGEDVDTLRLTGHFLGIGDPKDSLNKRVRVPGVYLGHGSGDPGVGHIRMTDDARLAEGKCP